MQDAVPEAAAAPRTELLPLADGRSFDLAAARSNLERYLELPTGEDALDRTDPTLDVLPAPPGTAWFRLRDGVDLESAAATRLGRLVLSRVDSAESVTTDDIRSITRADDTGANGIAVRLALRPERRGAFERMCAEAGGGVLLFVSRREVELAVRVGEGLPSRSGDVLVSGLSAAQAEVLIRGNDRRGP